MLIFERMITDFHTHCYPDALAPKAMRGVDDVTEGDADGTYAGLIRAMREAGVGRAVLLPVCARPGHERSVNAFAENLGSDVIVPFCSVHPHSDDAARLIREYADKGAKGVKFHPNLQNFDVRDPLLSPVWRAVRDAGIVAVFHCGKPGRRPTPLDAYPSDYLPLLGIIPPERVVLAHTGGYGITDEEIDVLASAGAYTDLSLAGQFTKERLRRALSRLRPDRILFGSDSPWRDIGKTADLVRSAVPDENMLDLIMNGNAERLLGVSRAPER